MYIRILGVCLDYHRAMIFDLSPLKTFERIHLLTYYILLKCTTCII